MFESHAIAKQGHILNKYECRKESTSSPARRAQLHYYTSSFQAFVSAIWKNF